MIIAIVGASGFLGNHFTKHLLKNTDFTVKAISRHASKITVDPKFSKRLIALDGDVFDDDQLTEDLAGADVAYYFVHMMGQANKDFYTQETLAAHRFSAAVKAAGVKRVIYMGGLGNDHEALSQHLASRHNTGTILREQCPLVLEFRASMIIGNGSISFDIIRNLVHKLPVMTLPRWAKSQTQPIALADALSYLTLAATVTLEHSRIIEIGGPEVTTYKQLYKEYASWSGRHPFIIRLPFLPEQVGGWWLDLFTPRKHAKIGRIMVHSMTNSMIVTHNHAAELFPSIHPRSIIQAFNDTRS